MQLIDIGTNAWISWWHGIGPGYHMTSISESHIYWSRGVVWLM